MGDRSVVVKDLPTDVEGTVIEISVFYQAGGYNWFHGTKEDGGFYVSATKVRVEKGDGYTSRSFGLGSGRKVRVEDASRFNARKLAKIVESVRGALADDSLGAVMPIVSSMILTVAAEAGVTLVAWWGATGE